VVEESLITDQSTERQWFSERLPLRGFRVICTLLKSCGLTSILKVSLKRRKGSDGVQRVKEQWMEDQKERESRCEPH
jgi:hypothetical protein